MVYLIAESENSEKCKIGYSENPQNRLSEINVSNPNDLHLLYVIDGDFKLEKKIQEIDRKSVV